MPKTPPTSRIFVTCQRHLAPYVRQEIEALDFHCENVLPTGVQLNGTIADCMKLNLYLRCASQVLFSLSRFRCNDPDDLYRRLSEIAWEDVLPADGYFSVVGHVSHPTIRSSMFAHVKTKDAIVDRMRKRFNRRPDTGAELRGAVVFLYWHGDWAEVFLDTSGETLAKHGYRKLPGKAPMVESLAAGTLFASRWDRRSPLVNPMCGSGTIAIEAALMATNRYPGLFRQRYAFQHLVGYDAKHYRQLRTDMERAIKPDFNIEIIATDISPAAVSQARMNAATAGVSQLIRFTECDFWDTPLPHPGEAGIVMLNPEYGLRLGDQEQLAETYSRIGDFLKKKCGGYTGYVFTGNLELAKRIGLKTKRRIEFTTADLDCRLLEYELYLGTRSKRAAVE